MTRERLVVLAINIIAIAGVTIVIDATGGLPSQLVHLFYLPVVISALLLPARQSLVVSLLAGAAVSPLPDLVHGPLGMPPFFPDPSPWNLSPSGWVVRPIAFVAISLLAARVVTLAGMLGQERAGKMTAQAASAYRGKELALLSQIDKMILAGSSEQESVLEIARLVAVFTGARIAGIELPDDDHKTSQLFLGYINNDGTLLATRERLPVGEGVSGWATLHGSVAVSRNVFSDARYEERMAEFARRVGYVSAAALPIVLHGKLMATLSVGYEQERDFSADDLASLERLADQASVAIANARQRESLERLAYDAAIALTDAIESRDPYTGDHCSRLARYAVATGAALGLSHPEIEVIRLGAALHDVGKIVVPDKILKKPGKLTPAEYAVIKQHCYSGGQICKRVAFLRAVYPIVYHPHEQFDGRGYPDGIAGNRIPLGARIVAVVDAFDAMTSDRPYRKAMPEEEAEAILRDGAGSQWDPQVVDAFRTTSAVSDRAAAAQ